MKTRKSQILTDARTERHGNTAQTATIRNILKLACFLLACTTGEPSYGGTPISGPVSGQWTTNGNPYYVGADANIPSGQILTIDPGVEVVLWPGVNFVAYGRLVAIGTTNQHIVFRGTWPTNYWNGLSIIYSGTLSQLINCDISDVNYGVYLYVGDVNATMVTEIRNCRFWNCPNACIYGDSVGYPHSSMGVPSVNEPVLNPTIKNCEFRASGNGCQFHIWGNRLYMPGMPNYWIYAHGRANPTLMNNIFNSISGSALELLVGTDADSSVATFVNNTVVSCGAGVLASDPFDATVMNSIFYSCGVGVQRSGSLSLNVEYNCFNGNGNNFVGYPTTYGQTLISNANGDPCDGFFNILLNPRFLDSYTLLLGPGSPCIDAGTPTISDVCFSVSRGTAVSDMGAYGGPDACNSYPPKGSAPVITAAPQGRSSCLGQSTSFCVRASGTEPLNYQWCFNSAIMPGHTNTCLTITNLQKSHAGAYSVLVSNVLGSTTSAPAQLVVNDACIDLRLYAGLNIAGQEGSTYILSYTANLNNTNGWIPLATNIMGSSGWFYLDMDSPFSPRRFYKVELKP
jgi:hypothetical protein